MSWDYRIEQAAAFPASFGFWTLRSARGGRARPRARMVASRKATNAGTGTCPPTTPRIWNLRNVERNVLAAPCLARSVAGRRNFTELGPIPRRLECR